MSKNTKILIIVAICLILIGLLIFCGVMKNLKWDFTKLSTSVFETNKYEFNDNFENIKVITKNSDVLFVPSSTSNTIIECYESINLKHTVKVENNTLVVEVNDTRNWYDYIGIYVNKPKITVYLPKSEYDNLLIDTKTGDVNIPKDFKFLNLDILSSVGIIKNNASVEDTIKINTSVGAIWVENINAKNVELSTSTGKVNLIDVFCESDIKVTVSTGITKIINTNCKNIISTGSTGKISLENVIATERISINRSTGDVIFKNSDSKNIYVKTSTGNVKGNLLTDKTFFVQTNTGKIDIPKTISEQTCEIETSTGDIKISI